MSHSTQIVPIEGRRLVLGFDGGCMTCSALAERIKEQADGKLEVLSLRDPQVTGWRRRAFGKDALWVPTLIEVKGLKVNAWTGWRLGVQLSRFLGPVATWRVMQALGEVSAVPRIEGSAIVEKLPGKAVVGMSRGKFLKGAAGAAVAMSVLSGFGPLARRAEALEPWQYPRSVDFRQLRGTVLRDYCNRIARRASCEWVAGGYASTMQSGLEVTSADDLVAQSSGVQARAGLHTLASGNELYVCTFALKQGEKIVTFYEYEHQRNGTKWEAKRWGLGPSGGKFWAERLDINGDQFTDPSAPSLQAAAACPEQCASFTSGQRQVTTCSSIDSECAADAIAAGIAGCAGAKATCKGAVGWALVVCVAASYLCYDSLTKNCCRNTCTICVNCYVSNT